MRNEKKIPLTKREIFCHQYQDKGGRWGQGGEKLGCWVNTKEGVNVPNLPDNLFVFWDSHPHQHFCGPQHIALMKCNIVKPALKIAQKKRIPIS